MPETLDNSSVAKRTDGDSSANESGFAGHLLSTPDNAELIRELNRTKVAFQLRAIKAVLGEVGK